MSEVASRPAASRGRGTTRGRGGFRGSTRARQTNGDAKDDHLDEDDSGQLSELKKQYSGQLKSLKELFVEWNDVDLLLALQETDGDLERTIDHISEGTVAQFSDVKKKAKDRSRSKVDAPPEPATRPSRGRGNVESSRGSRGRGERGRGAPRVGRGGQAAETRGPGADGSVPTPDSGAWGDHSGAGAGVKAASKSAAPEAKPAAPVPAAPPQKTWASMFAPKKPPPKVESAVSKPVKESPRDPELGAVPSSDISSGYVEVTHSDADSDRIAHPGQSIASQDQQEPPAIEIHDTNVSLPPPKDKLTEDNVENLPDVSHPAPVGTAASEVESSRGPDSTSISVVAAPTQPIPIGRPGLGGYATTALKATTPTGRSASFQRRLVEQQEAVVMPGNHAVDRAAVQFGSLGLNGDNEGLNVDDDREELETRAQPPQHSPVAQPKTSLPPAARAEAALHESTATVKPAPGLPPPASQQPGAQHAGAPHATQSAQPQTGHGFNQFGRYGQTHDGASHKQHYDPFGQQSQQQQQQSQSQYDAYGSSSQAQSQTQQATASNAGGYQTSSNDYYSSEQQRNAYQNYYGNYGQHDTASQQRSGSAFGAGNDSSYGSAQAQQSQSRFGENQSTAASGTSAAGGQQQGGSNQAQQSVQSHGQQQGYGGYNHPYYNQPYYTAYMNQYSGYGQQGFGAPFSKGGMYGHPQHGYGMPQSGYDQHSSSPAQTSNFGREGASSALQSDYTRSGSTQPGQSQSSATGGYAGDSFGRSPSNYSSQTGAYGQQAGSQQAGNDDPLKLYGEKASAGNNASSLGQPGRPSSASQSGQGLPPPQSQQGYAGYGNQYQGGQSQYGGSLGGLGGQGSQNQQHGYGSYSSYQNSYGQYGQGQQRGNSGWGGQNYGH